MIYYIRCTACNRMYGYTNSQAYCMGFKCNNLVSTTENATQIGPQRGPSSSAKINAKTKQAQRELDLAGEQRGDDQVVAGKKPSPYSSKERYPRGWHPNDEGHG